MAASDICREAPAVRSAAIVLPVEANFYQAAADALVVREGIAHASV